jgi:phage baseplate assembly protein gpV
MEHMDGVGAVRDVDHAVAVGRIRITDAGRRWLEDAAKSELRGPNRFKDFWRE